MLVLFKRHPELVEALSGAFGPQAVRSTLDGLDDFAPMLRFFADASRAWAAGERYLYRRMAEATGLPEADVRERLNTAGILRGNAFHYQRGDWLDILKDPAQSLAVLPSAEEMIQLYEGMAERFASRKGALYQSVDGLPGLSADYRAELKEAVLKRSALKLPSFFERCSRTAQGMYAAPLLRVLDAGEDDSVLLDAVRRLAQQYDSASHVTFSSTILADMGSDELSSIQEYSIGMFMELNPALRGSLAPERGNALIDQARNGFFWSSASWKYPPYRKCCRRPLPQFHHRSWSDSGRGGHCNQKHTAAWLMSTVLNWNGSCSLWPPPAPAAKRA